MPSLVKLLSFLGTCLRKRSKELSQGRALRLSPIYICMSNMSLTQAAGLKFRIYIMLSEIPVQGFLLYKLLYKILNIYSLKSPGHLSSIA